MVLAIKELKLNSLVFPDVSHITCLAHCLNVVVSEIEKNNPLVNKYLVYVKKVLNKSRKRRLDFKTSTSLSKLPPHPVQTRWGTWLVAVKYHLQHFDDVKKFMLGYKPDSNPTAHEDMKRLLDNTELEVQLYGLRNLLPLADHIKQLEDRELSALDQFDILIKVEHRIKGTAYVTKFEKSLLKNPDLFKFIFGYINLAQKLNREYCPLVSVEVERSFSQYKAFYRSNRNCLTEENIKHMMVIYCNSFLTTDK